MADKFILGIDVGTTSVKAAVLDLAGSIHAEFNDTYPTHRTAGQIVEQHPLDWTSRIDQALEAFAQYEIAVIGICSQVNTHVFVDKKMHPLQPAIQWQDARASDAAAQIDAGVSDEQKIEWWGAPMPIDASHALSRMQWMSSHSPDVWEKTAHVLLPKDFCIAHLIGRVTTDPLSNIGLVGADGEYIDGVLDLVPGASERMAPIVPVTEIAGTVQRGPFAGVPVVSGAMDAWAGLIGAGGARESSTVYLSGTSEIVGISAQSVSPAAGVIVFPESNGIRLHAGPTQNGGDAQLWFADTFGISLDSISDAVNNQPRCDATPLFLPQLEGERAPLWNASLRAAFLNVSRQTNRADFARAVYEGVAFAARHILEACQRSSGVQSDWVAGGGGGFQSDAWNQIRADVLGVPVRRLVSSQPGVVGAAIIAAIGAGLYDDFTQASTALAVYGQEYQPDVAAHDRYNQLFAIYQDAIANADQITSRLRALQ